MGSSSIDRLKKTGRDEKSDECYTPNEAVLPIIPFLKKGLVYYDCTSGISSQLVDSINNSGFTCKSGNGLDFLSEDVPSDIDVIITNPPYSKKDDFIERCYQLGKPFALLMPVTALQGKRRGKLFIDNGIEVLTLNSRIDFTGNKSPHFGVAWFCHRMLPEKLMFAEVENA